METTQTETVVENNVAVAAAGEGVDLTPTPTLTPRRRSLLPILPQQSVPLGSLVVDKEETRVVYLAPLMSASKEIYFAKHKDLLKAGPVTNVHGQGEEEREMMTKKKMLASLERHLSRVQKPTQQVASLNQQSSSNLFNVPSSDELSRNLVGSNVPEAVPVTASPADTELKKMKQRVKLLPITDQDHTDFWKTIRGYERMRAYYHRAVLTSGAATPMGYNMESAFNKMLLEERHMLWVNCHENRLEGNKIRKVQEDENYERRVIEASSEYRAQQRSQRDTREQLIAAAQNMLPLVMLTSFSQKMLDQLVLHWNRCRLEYNVRRIARVWRHHRSTKHSNLSSANLLIEWLQKSVAVKSVGFRVFRGLRIYLRRVKRVQGLWRRKQAIRHLQFLIIEKAWVELETKYVDAAFEHQESMRLEVEQLGAQKKSPKSKPRKKRDLWMRFVPESFRSQVILEFLQKTEKEFTEKFRQQEIEFFPQLVQTLRGEHPNRARTFIRAVAKQHELCGQVVDTLLRYPGAVGEGVAIVKPFDVHLVPVDKLLNEGRARCMCPKMQNDNEARHVLEAAVSQKNEERRKQLALLLQRRQQLRQTAPVTTDTVTPVSAPPPSTISSQVEPNQLEKAIPRQSFALVVVSYSFRNLPALSEKTKDVATSLFDSLVNQHFNRFSRRGSRLLLNPSVIEFQDTMKELKKICAEETDSSFFMCMSTHGARVTRGAKEGSYVLFSETRLSSEEELVLTAIHERDLAEMIHDIPCKNKFVALELCQAQEPKEKRFDDAETIHHRIHEQFFSQVYKKIVKLRLRVLLDRGVRLPSNEEVTEEAVRTDSKLLNIILMESCDAKNEAPVRANDECVSNFLLRFRDAFRGAAVVSKLDEDEPNERRSLLAKELLKYVSSSVREDATKHNASVYAEYKGQMRTRYEHAAEFQDITHTPGVLGADHAIDFGLGEIPEPPIVSPTPPAFVTSTLNSISITWNFAFPSTNAELPVVLGYHVQRRGHGPACADGEWEAGIWKRAAAFQVLSFEDVVRNAMTPPTTITAYGLSSDTAYCFRVRARTAGGWGPFSKSSPGYRTLSVASIQDQRETIRLTASREGARGIMNLMTKHSNSGPIQRYAAEILAIMAITGSSVARAGGGTTGLQLLTTSDFPVVVALRNAMQKFKRDMHLHQQGCLAFGRLAAASGTWQAALRSITDPSVLQVLHNVATRSGADNNHELTRCANWAITQFQGAPKALRGIPEMSACDAATRLQNLYRCRKAREEVRALARSVYSQAIDPDSGMTYVFNIRTGATFWALPQFAV